MQHPAVVSSIFGSFDPSDPRPTGALFESIVGIEPILVRAPREIAWEVMVDFESYPEWNPLNRHFRADPTTELHARVTFGCTLRPPDAEGRFPEPDRVQVETITVWEPGRCLSYADVGFGYRNERTQYLWSDGPDRTFYLTYERFSGVLGPLVRALYGERVRAGFLRNALALRERAEARAATERTRETSARKS